MDIKSQVVSLDLAMKLKDLGVKQNSLFYWEKSEYRILINESGEKEIEEYRISLCMPPMFDLSQSIDYWSAYTVAELGEILPLGRISSKSHDGWYMSAVSPLEKWKRLYPCKTEADARATTLIHLIEENDDTLLTEEWRKQWLTQ